jgi:hypothetical protein
MSELYGDWDKALKTFQNMKGLSTSDMAYEIIDTGDAIADRIKEYIESQDLALQPLTEEYLNRKVSEGYDPRILIRTGEFVDNIEVTDVDESDNTAMVFVSVKDGTTSTGISLKELAEFLEYGTSRMPARYPFTLSWEKMRGEIKRNVARRMMVMLEGVVK